MTCPEVFQIDDVTDKSHVMVDDVPAHLEERVRQAVRNCPEGAISSEG
jgi:ferredoxin